MTAFLSEKSMIYVSYDTYVYHGIMRQFDMLQSGKSTLILNRFINLIEL